MQKNELGITIRNRNNIDNSSNNIHNNCIIHVIKMKLKIKDIKPKPFTSDDGETINYYWYKAERLSDNVTFQFGSLNGEHAIGENLDLEIEKTEKADGKFGYKEVIVK